MTDPTPTADAQEPAPEPSPDHARSRPAPPDPDDRPRPPRRRDDRDRWRDGQGRGGRPSSHPHHVHARRDGRDRRPGDGHARRTTAASGETPGGRAGAGDGPSRRDRVGEPRLPRLGHDGSAGQPRPAQLLAGGPRRGDRPARVVRPALPARRHHDLQRLRWVRPPGPHPDPPRRGRGVRAGRGCRLVPGAARPGARRHRSVGRGRRARPVDAVEALRAGDPGIGPPGDGRRLKELGQRSFWDAARGRDARADRGVRGVRREDAGARRGGHDLAGHLRRAGRREVGRHPRARDPDQRRQPVHAAGSGRLAGGLVEGGVHPARVAGPTSLPETDLFAGIA